MLAVCACSDVVYLVTIEQPHGIITVRLRVEMHDEKAALMAAFKPRPKIHVNVKKEKSFHVVRYTCFGEVSSLAYVSIRIDVSIMCLTHCFVLHINSTTMRSTLI